MAIKMTNAAVACENDPVSAAADSSNAVRPKPAVIWSATRSYVREPSHAIRDSVAIPSVHDDPARHTTARRLERPGIAAIMRGALIALRNRGGLAPGT
jgi:hypothetical protein